MANEKRLIDANEFLNRLNNCVYDLLDTEGELGYSPEIIKAVLDQTNTVDAVEVVHGHWRKVYTCHGEQAWGYECDQCKADNPRASYYCPNCGATMDGGKDNA